MIIREAGVRDMFVLEIDFVFTKSSGYLGGVVIVDLRGCFYGVVLWALFFGEITVVYLLRAVSVTLFSLGVLFWNWFLFDVYLGNWKVFM